MSVQAQGIKALHGFVFLGLAAVFLYNLTVQILSSNVISQVSSVKTNTSLVPPALTLCVGDQHYIVNVSVYGEYPDQSGFLTSFTNEQLNQYGSLGRIISQCWIIRAPDNASIIQNPPPAENTPDMVVTYTRFINNDTSSPIWLNVFDPLQTSTLFTFNRFLELDADQNRAISFTRTVHFDVHGKETNDVLYNIATEYRDPSWTVPGSSATSKFTIRAASFDIAQISDVNAATPWSIFRDCFTLLGVLYSVYLPIVGRGKYRPWGILHSVMNYYPVEHIKQKDQADSVTKEEIGLIKENIAPTIDEKLDLYLAGFQKAKYD